PRLLSLQPPTLLLHRNRKTGQVESWGNPVPQELNRDPMLENMKGAGVRSNSLPCCQPLRYSGMQRNVWHDASKLRALPRASTRGGRRSTCRRGSKTARNETPSAAPTAANATPTSAFLELTAKLPATHLLL
ncbi:hypothetical protein Vafri_17559, partial [Volvox africanus]